MSAAAKLKPYAQLTAAGLIAILGVAVGVTAIGHAFDPVHIGLWSGPHLFLFGALDGSVRAHQLPDSTLNVVALVVVGLSGLIVRELIGFARAGLARQAR